MGLAQIPLVDIAPFVAGNPADKQSVATEIGRACEEIGFLMIAGHGIAQNLIDETLAVTWQFFDLPEDDKRRWLSPAGDGRRGYLPVGGNAPAYTLDQASPPDLIEAFTFGRFDLPDDPYYTAHGDTWFKPNIWPNRPPHFRRQLCTYYRAMEGLAHDLMRMFAIALALPEDYFADKIDHHITAMRLNRYARATPAVAGPTESWPTHRLRQPHHPLPHAQSRRGASSRRRWWLARCSAATQRFRRQSRRSHGAVKQRSLGIDAASCGQSAAGGGRRQPACLDSFLPPVQLRRHNHLLRDLPWPR